MVTRKRYLASNNTTATIALIYSCICFSMALHVEFRFVLVMGAALLAFIFFLISPFVLKHLNIFLNKKFLWILSINLLICFEGFYAASINGQMPIMFIFISLFSLFSVLAIYIILTIGSKRQFFYYFQIFLLIAGILAAPLHFLFGYEILENQNSYSNLFIPTLFYYSFVDRNNLVKLLIVFAITILISIIHEARLVSIIAMIIVIAFPLANSKLIINISALVSLALTLTFVYYTVYFNTELNELLTNRLLIWQYYLLLSSQNLYFGFGYIDPIVAESAARYVEFIIQKGANTQYGTQSMIFRYIYDNGLIMAFLFYLFIFKEFFRDKSYGLLAIFGYLPTLLESIKFGTPSIFGCIFMVTFLMSYTSEEET